MFTQTLVAGGDGLVNWARGPAGGEPLVFLHGVGRSWQDFAALTGVLAARWEINALDFRGHGSSDRTPGKYLVRDYVRDAVALVREHVRRPVILYGHSLGALVAAATAAELPDLVRGAVLEDPPFTLLGPNISQTPFQTLFRAFAEVSKRRLGVIEMARALADIHIPTPDMRGQVRLGDGRDEVSLRFSAECLRRADPALWEPLADGGWMVGYDYPALLKHIHCPVLLLHGDAAEGGMMPQAVVDEVARTLPDCTKVLVAGPGHLIHNLAGELTLRLVTSFCEAISLPLTKDTPA